MNIYIDNRIIDIDEQLANMGEELLDLSSNFVETNNENVIYDQSVSYDQYVVYDKNDNCCLNLDELLCCLCGISKKFHSITHRFVECLDEYKCIKCHKFFYQHDHLKNPCFCPKKYIY